MLLPSDWGQGKNSTLFMFNNVPSGKADDPQYRNPRQSGNVRLVIDFAAAVNHNITVLACTSLISYPDHPSPLSGRRTL